MTKLSIFSALNLFLCLCIFVTEKSLFADSLWQRRVTVNYNLFDDNRGKRVGDIVTVLVVEETSIENDESSNTNNTGGHSGEISNNAFLSGLQSALMNDRNAKFSERAANNYSAKFSQDFSGKGAYDSSRSINLRITAMIVEVLDNGNLVLEGKREVEVNKEKYNLRLTGIARPIDISTDNVILSSQMSTVNFFLH